MVFPFLRSIFFFLFLCRDSSFISTLYTYFANIFFFTLYTIPIGHRNVASFGFIGDKYSHHIRFIGILLTYRELGKRFISYNFDKRQRHSYTNSMYIRVTQYLLCKTFLNGMEQLEAKRTSNSIEKVSRLQ